MEIAVGTAGLMPLAPCVLRREEHGNGEQADELHVVTWTTRGATWLARCSCAAEPFYANASLWCASASNDARSLALCGRALQRQLRCFWHNGYLNSAACVRAGGLTPSVPQRASRPSSLARDWNLVQANQAHPQLSHPCRPEWACERFD